MKWKLLVVLGSWDKMSNSLLNKCCWQVADTLVQGHTPMCSWKPLKELLKINNTIFQRICIREGDKMGRSKNLREAW